MTAIIAWVQAHLAEIAFGLFLLSEALSLIPAVKANGIFQMVAGWIASFNAKENPPKAA